MHIRVLKDASMGPMVPVGPMGPMRPMGLWVEGPTGRPMTEAHGHVGTMATSWAYHELLGPRVLWVRGPRGAHRSARLPVPFNLDCKECNNRKLMICVYTCPAYP